MNETILIVDDEPNVRKLLRRTFEKEGFDVREAGNASRALQVVRETSPDLVLLDQRLPDGDGLDALQRIKDEDTASTVIMITAYGELRSAVTAMRLGAYDYVSKPFEMEELKLTVEKALEASFLRDEVRFLHGRDRQERVTELVGESAAVQSVRDVIAKVASSPTTTVLIQGESGTGKELVANLIHDQSERAEKPFLAINCAAFPASLLESELFGYEKGAFTDAKTRKRGLFEYAHGGTLFLDEIGELDPSLQSKLHRVLQERTVKRVGGAKAIPVEVRVVAATNRNLEDAIRDGSFREDLFFRLNVVPLHLPALRDRGEDVLRLTEHFIRAGNEKFGQDIRGLEAEVEQVFLAYPWPGNVRELQNLIERIMILESGDNIRPEHLPPEFGPSDRPLEEAVEPFQLDGSFREIRLQVVAEYEEQTIRALLEKHGGDVRNAAVEAKLNLTEYRKLMRKYGVEGAG